MTQDEFFEDTLERFIELDLERALSQVSLYSCWLILYESDTYEYGNHRHFSRCEKEAFKMLNLPCKDHETPAQFLRDQLAEDRASSELVECSILL